VGVVHHARGCLTREILTYYLDASLQIDVCRALALVRRDIEFPGRPGCPITSPGTPDEDWLPVAGQHGWVVVMRDKHIRTRVAERRALLDAGVRAFCLTAVGNYSKWQTLDLLVRRWPDIDRITAEEPGPYIYAVTHEGVKRRVS
jgi:PIN domain-containing protein